MEKAALFGRAFVLMLKLCTACPHTARNKLATDREPLWRRLSTRLRRRCAEPSQVAALPPTGVNQSWQQCECMRYSTGATVPDNARGNRKPAGALTSAGDKRSFRPVGLCYLRSIAIPLRLRLPSVACQLPTVSRDSALDFLIQRTTRCGSSEPVRIC